MWHCFDFPVCIRDRAIKTMDACFEGVHTQSVGVSIQKHYANIRHWMIYDIRICNEQ